MSEAPMYGDDHALSDRLARGDRQALELLYQAHGGAVLAAAVRVLKDREEAADVVQETFLEAWRTATHYQPQRARIGAWLITIARSRAIDRLRSRAAAERRAEAVGPHLCTPAEPPDMEVERQRDRTTVRQRLAMLPAEQRHVLELAWNEGLTQSEIALRTGVPLGTVKTRTRQGLLKLSAALRGDGA